VPKRTGDDTPEAQIEPAATSARVDETAPLPPALQRLFDGHADPVDPPEAEAIERDPK
jgi:hypothetical protein